jgi:cation diffusion facilitator CzcD-associated flavoprotein CzcO
MINRHLPVAIIGAGPVGLAAAAHLVRRGQAFVVLEAGPAVAGSVRQWGHVRMFTPWRYCVDTAARELLESSAWTHPAMEAIPTGTELVRDYLEPLAALPAMAGHIRLNSRVAAVTRKACDKVRTQGREELPFALRIEAPDGSSSTIEAGAVIDASGTWATPNPAGADGLPAIGEDRAGDRVSYGIPDVLNVARAKHAGRINTVVGGGHSALNTLIDLAALREQARNPSGDKRAAWR